MFIFTKAGFTQKSLLLFLLVVLELTACCLPRILFSQQKQQAIYDLPVTLKFSPTPEVQALTDSALRIVNMAQHDMMLRGDLVTKDAHRLTFVEKSFDVPLNLPWALRSIASSLYDIKSYPNATGSVVMNLLDNQLSIPNRDTVESYIRNKVDNKIIGTITYANGVSEPLKNALKRSIVVSAFFDQYIAPSLVAWESIDISQRRFRNESLLSSRLDSTVLLEEDAEASDPYKMKFQERLSDSISRITYTMASSYSSDNIVAQGFALYRELLQAVSYSANARLLFNDSLSGAVITLPEGDIYIGSTRDDVYSKKYFMIIDLGGNDTYSFTTTKSDALSQPVRVIIDVVGNDTYLAPSGYAVGSAYGGCDILIDANGDDNYVSGSFSQGAAIYGIGILHDMAGADSYKAGVFAQGAGAFGVGLLIDEKGNDSYTLQAHGQAFASTRGFGGLVDLSGNDIYATVSPFVDVLRYDAHYVSFTQGAALGSRPIASGGIAVLADADGNDTYISDIYGQGTGYWFGIGGLIDERGEDRYQSYQYAQGSGVHFAHGVLLDGSGDDVYVSHGVSQGCGHDVGAGILIDESGNDTYIAESLSLGGGNANAISVAVDCLGNDVYSVKNLSNTLGFSDFRRQYGMFGALIDGSGVDSYTSAVPTMNNVSITKSTFGVLLDTKLSMASSTNQSLQGGSPKSNSMPTEVVLSSTLDSLFIQASTAPQKFQYMVNPAREAIIAKAKIEPEVVRSFIAKVLSTESPRERLALEYILPKLYTQDSILYETLIVDSLASKNNATFALCSWVVGKSKIQKAQSAFEQFIVDADWKRRSAIAMQSGIGSMNTMIPILQRYADDKDMFVRMRVAYSLAQLDAISSTTTLATLIDDKFQLVRNSAIMGLFEHKPLRSSVYLDIFQKVLSKRGKRALAKAITATDTLAANTILPILAVQSDDVRTDAYRAMLESNNTFWNSLSLQLLQNEPSDIQWTLQGLVASLASQQTSVLPRTPSKNNTTKKKQNQSSNKSLRKRR